MGTPDMAPRRGNSGGDNSSGGPPGGSLPGGGPPDGSLSGGHQSSPLFT